MRYLNAVYFLLISLGLIFTGFIYILFKSGRSVTQDIRILFLPSPFKEILGSISILVGIMFGYNSYIMWKKEQKKEDNELN